MSIFPHWALTLPREWGDFVERVRLAPANPLIDKLRAGLDLAKPFFSHRADS
jgi:hypothetical protein